MENVNQILSSQKSNSRKNCRRPITVGWELAVKRKYLH